MDKNLFIQNLGQIRKRKILFIRIGLSCLFIILVTHVGLSKSGQTQSFLTIFKMTAIAFLAGLTFFFLSILQKMSRRLDLHCPNCQRNLSGLLSDKVLSTDQCFQCGMKLFD